MARMEFDLDRVKAKLRVTLKLALDTPHDHSAYETYALQLRETLNVTQLLAVFQRAGFGIGIGVSALLAGVGEPISATLTDPACWVPRRRA